MRQNFIQEETKDHTDKLEAMVHTTAACTAKPQQQSNISMCVI